MNILSETEWGNMPKRAQVDTFLRVFSDGLRFNPLEYIHLISPRPRYRWIERSYHHGMILAWGQTAEVAA